MKTTLTCPFCGGENLDVRFYGYDSDAAYVWCLTKKCSAMGPTRQTAKAAIKAWEKSNERRPAEIGV